MHPTQPVPTADSIAALKAAIDRNHEPAVRALMTEHPELHQAPMGYAGDGPLTWAAECRIPREAPGPARLAIVRWMIENGSDVHRGGDAPLMRAALDDSRIPMMELLVEMGADVNAWWHGNFPILFAPCEAMQPAALKWLLGHSADPNCGTGENHPGTALDYLIRGYVRDPDRLAEMIGLLLAAGGRTRYTEPALLAILRGDIGALRTLLDEEPALVQRRFAEFDFGATGARRLTLAGATLLHVAAEFLQMPAAELLLGNGADANARSDAPGGVTPLFHAVTQFADAGLEMADLLIRNGADVNVRARAPGHYEQPDEIVDCGPLEYATRFPGEAGPTVELLRSRGAHL